MSKQLLSSKDVFGILILVSGVFVGVLLIQQNLEYREKAANENKAVMICHLEDREKNVRYEMKVLPSNLQKHVDHGDLLGECPDSESVN